MIRIRSMVFPMPLDTPYTYDEQKLPDFIRNNLIRTDTFDFQGEKYTFGIVKPEAAPFPYFVGMNGGNNLFTSEEVVSNEALKFATLGHEILCNRTHAELDGPVRCPMSERDILSMLEPGLQEDVLKARLEMFNGLVQLNKIDPENPGSDFNAQLLATREFIEREIDAINR